MTQSKTEGQRIVEALQKLLEEAESAVIAYGEARDKAYANGVRDALSRAQSIAEGFK